MEHVFLLHSADTDQPRSNGVDYDCLVGIFSTDTAAMAHIIENFPSPDYKIMQSRDEDERIILRVYEKAYGDGPNEWDEGSCYRFSIEKFVVDDPNLKGA